MKTPKVAVITVTPENVDEHLLKCKSNRSRTKRHINTWVRAIEKGLFRDGGFIFADGKGFYDDGQHRLYALKVTHHTSNFIVVSGVDREALNMMVDAGKKRTNRDRMAAAQVKRAGIVTTSIEEILDLTEHWRNQIAMILPDEIFAYYHAHKIDLDTLAEAWSTSGIKDIPHKFLVALQILFTEINKEKSDKFFKDITHRQLLRKGDPVHAFYQMLASEAVRNDQKTSRVNRYIRNGLIIAWNATLAGETVFHMEPTERAITLEGTPLASSDSEQADMFGSAGMEESADDEDEEGDGDAEPESPE